ncbi:MAG: hypothetical protein R3D80_13190 [Paracoccaceae bacterium]
MRPATPIAASYAQMWNNRRFEVDMTPYPVISRIFDALDALPRSPRLRQPGSRTQGKARPGHPTLQ